MKNADDYIKQCLIKSGIPENEIGIIHDADTDAKRAELFHNIRKGIVRVGIGSTEKMGTGTNVQNKLIAAHDVDVPWTPKEMEQRLGRTVRRGNENEHVDIYRYTTKGSFDVFRLETIKRKAVAISAAMSDPRTAVRRYEEDTEIDFDTLIAETTDNPIIKEKAKIDSQIMLLTSKQNLFETEKWRNIERKRDMENALKIYGPIFEELAGVNQRIVAAIQGKPKFKALPEATDTEQKKIQMYSRLVQAEFTTFGVIDGIQEGDTVWIEIEAARSALEAVYVSSVNSKSSPKRIAVYGECAAVRRTTQRQHSETISIDEIRYYDGNKSDPESAYFLDGHYGSYCKTENSSSSMIFRGVLNYLPNDMLDNLKSAKYRVEEAQGGLTAIASINLTGEFPQQAELNEAIARRAVIEAEIIEVMKTVAEDKAKKGWINMDSTLKAFEKAGFDPNFDPYSHRVKCDEDIEIVEYQIAAKSPALTLS